MTVKAISAAIVAAGVVWRDCSTCGRDWPFPKGDGPHPVREWKCHVCLTAECAAMMRRAAEGSSRG